VAVIALLLAAVAVGLSNLAAAIGIGVTGVNARVRLQVGLVFGVFEAGMPVVGLLIGQRFATDMDTAGTPPRPGAAPIRPTPVAPTPVPGGPAIASAPVSPVSSRVPPSTWAASWPAGWS